MKRKAMLVTALTMSVLMGLSVVGCGSSGGEKSADKSTSTKKSDEDKTITFWNTGTEGADKETYDRVVEKFNKENKGGWTVENIPTQNDKYKEKLVIAMSSGECPDMYTTWSGGPMNEYIKSGYAQPLDELYDKYEIKDRFMEGALEQASYDGKLYAIPVKNISVAGIYYNKDLFEKYDIEVPKTLDELEKACDIFLENGITPFTLANATKWTGSMYFQCLAARKAGLEPFQNAAAGTGTFEDESFVWAGEKIQEWVNKGYFPDGFNSMNEDDGQSKQLFYQETAAMYLTGSWSTASFKTDSEDGGSDFYDKIGWFSFPAVSDSDADSSILCGTMGDQFISFNCKDEKLDAAFEMASNFSSEETVEFMIGLNLIPPIKGIESKVTDPLSKSIVEAANNASAVQLWYDQYLDPSVANAHLDGNQEVFGLTMTPEEANKKMQDAQQEYLNK